MTTYFGKYFNIFSSSVIILSLISVFIMNSINWFESWHADMKENMEDKYTEFPDEQTTQRVKQTFETYIKATNRAQSDDVIILNDGRMIYKPCPDPPLLKDRADEIAKLSDYLNGMAVPFLLVTAPCAMKDNTQLPFHIRDEVRIIEDSQRFMRRLTNNGVSVFDLRKEMMQDNIDFSEYYFHGDYHWNAYGAMYGYGKIGEYLNSNYGYGLDEKTWDLSEYDEITFHDAFTGALSQMLGNAGEDITVLIPAFHTDIVTRRLDPGNPDDHLRRGATGSFIDVFVPKLNDDDIESFRYAELSNRRYHRLINQSADNEKRILFIADTFGHPVASYLSTAFYSVDYLYIDGNRNRILYPLLESEEYDIVLFLVSELSIYADGTDITGDRLYFGEE